MVSRILLVEDDPSVALTLSDLLSAEGYDVERAKDGAKGWDRAITGRFDLIILDVMLPGKSGFEICRQLRQQGSKVAILMLTARTDLTDRVAGLKLGADDYLVKPFEPPELLARVQALLRRLQKNQLPPLRHFQFEGVDVDFHTGQVSREGNAVSLTPKELDLLRFLIERQDRVVTREELLEGVWHYQPGISSRTVDVHVAWLRQKLETDPQNPRYLQTVRGVGYRFCA